MEGQPSIRAFIHSSYLNAYFETVFNSKHYRKISFLSVPAWFAGGPSPGMQGLLGNQVLVGLLLRTYWEPHQRFASLAFCSWSSPKGALELPREGESGVLGLPSSPSQSRDPGL